MHKKNTRQEGDKQNRTSTNIPDSSVWSNFQLQLCSYMLSFRCVTDKRFYRERRSFLCIDGSRVIPFEQVNDDYCDCEDGSDEPGHHTHTNTHTHTHSCTLSHCQCSSHSYAFCSDGVSDAVVLCSLQEPLPVRGGASTAPTWVSAHTTSHHHESTMASAVRLLLYDDMTKIFAQV